MKNVITSKAPKVAAVEQSTGSVISGVFSTQGSLWMGTGTCEVPLEAFRVNRRRLCKRILDKFEGRPLILLEGGCEVPLHNTDIDFYNFKQESYFMWAFGVIEPNCFGAIDVNTGNTYLFFPRVAPGESVWRGCLTLEELSGRYDFRNVAFTDEIEKVIFGIHPTIILTLKGVNSDSGLPVKEAHFKGIQKYPVDNLILFQEMSELRVFKTDLEINVLKYVIELTSEAHRLVMRYVKGGNKYEYQCEAEFLRHIYSVGGCRNAAYTPRCCSTGSSAILHYGNSWTPNDKFINPGETCLFDMGACYFGFCASVTCSFPVSGRFSADQKLVYEAVLQTGRKVLAACKPGVSWLDMHLLGLRTLMEELVAAGLLKGEPKDMVDVGLAATFQPHGIGHFMGLDVHDVGGYLEGTPPRRGEPRGTDKLRTARVLQDRMVLTIGPGCYFIDSLLDQALADPVYSKYLVPAVLQRFRGFGGIRITDNVLITPKGAVYLTKMPRTVAEIERWMAGKDDKKYRRPSYS